MDPVNLPSDVYDKDLNFLIGSGASVGLFPTLALKIRDEAGDNWTIERLASHFEGPSDPRFVPLFMHYYNECVRPAQLFNLSEIVSDPMQDAVIDNYDKFLRTVLYILQKRKSMDKRCNIFTTNYDGCFQLIADNIIKEGRIDFVLNDGARGFSRRHLHVRNYNTYLCQTGVFERHQSSVAQINLVHLHGSVYWTKEGSGICVEPQNALPSDLLNSHARKRLQPFSDCLKNDSMRLSDLKNPHFQKTVVDRFWASYTDLPIVNPLKWKFHETVFEEHYYQMLRMLSYELEKPNAVLVAFGFSFSDEHILNLIKRSLSNPHLQVFICCYNTKVKAHLENEFRGHINVKYIALDSGVLDFTAFNQQIFSLEKTDTPALAHATTSALSSASPTPGGIV